MSGADLDQSAAAAVAELRALGAAFTVARGALGSSTWTYALPDEANRAACRRVIAGADLRRQGGNAAMVAAIEAAG